MTGGGNPTVCWRGLCRASPAGSLGGGALGHTHTHSRTSGCGPDPANLPPLLRAAPRRWVGGPAGPAGLARASEDARGRVQLN